MEDPLLQAVVSAIRSATGDDPGACRVRKLGGGCIHEAYVLLALTPYFVKVNSAAHQGMFDAEQGGLRALAVTRTLRVPRPITAGIAGQRSFLVLEFIPLAAGSKRGWHDMGESLAAMHRTVSPDGRFGWHRANFIGATPQPNAWHGDWITFWRDHRLGFQFKLAASRGITFTGSGRLLDHLDAFFDGYTPAPSLLHGDLWSGNASFTDAGAPVIYDPACYFGDRECDLAFTEMFGGFPVSFYEAYDAAWPRDEGWRRRRDLYNLYHVLNHFHLFGGAYRDQAQQIIRALNDCV